MNSAHGQHPSASEPVARQVPREVAGAFLVERIDLGEQLIEEVPRSRDELDELWHRADRWRDLNRTWLDVNLPGTAADEYREASSHFHSIARGSNPDRELRFIRTEISDEVSKLKSIQARLGVLAPAPSATASDDTVQSASDGPIFIVHGTDTLRAESVAHTVSRVTGRETIILREQPNLGRTLIEKFEQHAEQVSYAIIVLTPDDKGCRADESEARPRARQNVIFEMGYFFGLIGRRNVCALLHPGVEKPSDMEGIVYISFDDNGAWKSNLFRELYHAGFSISY